jgi:hypothetical protein
MNNKFIKDDITLITIYYFTNLCKILYILYIYIYKKLYTTLLIRYFMENLVYINEWEFRGLGEK